VTQFTSFTFLDAAAACSYHSVIYIHGVTLGQLHV
jgi:hypothetical protein